MHGHDLSDKPEDDEFYASKRFAEDFDAGFKLHKPFFAGWYVI